MLIQQFHGIARIVAVDFFNDVMGGMYYYAVPHMFSEGSSD